MALKNNNKTTKDNINSKVKFKIRTWSNKTYKAQIIHKNNKPKCTKIQTK